MLTAVRWGVVVIGTAAGLFVMAIAGLAVFAVGLLLGGDDNDLARLLALTFALFLGQFFAGYAAGRLSSSWQPARHGSFAGLLLYGVIATLGLAAGSDIGPLSLFFFAVVGMVLGLAGGVLAGRPRDDDAPAGPTDGAAGTE